MARRLQIQKRSPVSTFHPFKRLPFELRSKIWLLYDFPGPRIVEIFFKSIPPPSGSSANSSKYLYKIVSPTKPPRLAFVNQESRAEIKRIYRTLDLGPDFYIPFEIYVDFKIDTIHLSAIGQLTLSGDPYVPILDSFPRINLTQSPQLSQLRSLAINSEVFSSLHLPTFLSTHCPNLTTLMIPFLKTSLHDIKPASEYETLTFMDDAEYFAAGSGAYTNGLFLADWRLGVSAGEAWSRARGTVMKHFLVEGESSEERIDSVGILKSDRMIEGTWMGGGFGMVVAYDIEIGGRRVELRFVVALYPREKKFEGLKPRLSMNRV